MDRKQNLKWLFLDLNSYFASVEQQERPHLRGKPVAVVPMPTDATCAIAASYEAKAYGIKTGTKIYEARKMCPNLQCVLARHDLYVAYHHKIIAEVVKHTPIHKIWSIDELSSRLTPNKRTIDQARALSRRIKQGIWQNVGKHINCSIGIAPNSLLAKMAGETQKPDGLVIWHQEDLPEALFALQLTDIPGVGINMERRLHRAGINTMEALWNTSPKQARRIWGSVQGERMWYWLHGYDFEPPETGNVMIGHSRMLDPHLRKPDKARAMARRLLVKATYRLRRKDYYASRLSLGVRTAAGYRWRDERVFAAAHDPFTFLHHLDILWDQMMLYFHPTSCNTPQHLPRGSGNLFEPAKDPCLRREYESRDTQITFKKVSVVLHGLRRKEEITDDLLNTQRHAHLHRLQKREALANALDTLQNKYQKETVSLGVPPKTLAGHVGTKIAFSRVPDQEEFWG